MAQNVSSRALGPRELITLAQPRPGQARITNDYIETPLRPRLPLPTSSSRDGSGASEKRATIPPPKDPLSPASLPLPTVHGATAAARHQQNAHHQHGRRHPTTGPHRGSSLSSAVVGVTTTVTTQPTTFKKDKAREAAGASGLPESGGEDGHTDSIICRECRRCKCEACRTPRPLPSKWICNDKFPCSAQAMVDYCSCLCCVKGLFYHITKDYEMDSDVSCADKPCSCAPHKCCARWTCLGLLSLALPCLCFYWPLRGCVRLCEIGYSGVTGKGCRCHRRTEKSSTKAPPEKRLLDSNSDC